MQLHKAPLKLSNFDGNDEPDFNKLFCSKELQDCCANPIYIKDGLTQRSDLIRFWLSFLEVI